MSLWIYTDLALLYSALHFYELIISFCIIMSANKRSLHCLSIWTAYRNHHWIPKTCCVIIIFFLFYLLILFAVRKMQKILFQKLFFFFTLQKCFKGGENTRQLPAAALELKRPNVLKLCPRQVPVIGQDPTHSQTCNTILMWVNRFSHLLSKMQKFYIV